jgi:NAD(P)-dependent dehydrogenase (short-subunit alcohol dehydrogenase family)
MAAIADISDVPLSALLSLSGRTAVVTGGGQGLGKGIARRLVEAGANILIGDIDASRAEKAAADLASYPGRVLATQLDVTNSASIAATVELARAQLGGVDIWVNNAGIFPSIPVTEMTDADWDAVFAVNSRGVFSCSREAAKAMEAGGRGGVIVNIVSLAGFGGIAPGLAAYVASKHAALGLTRQMALELAPKGIRVLAVAPGFVLTEGNMALIQQQQPEMLQLAGQNIPSMLTTKLGRVGVPDDIARAVLFCASDMSMFMTGTMLVVDGGETI